MSDAADEIADVAEDIAKKRAASAAEQAQIAKLAETAKIVGPIPGTAAILRNLEIEGILPVGRTAALPAGVAISGLPETGYERLVGREADFSASTKPGATTRSTSCRSSPRAARANRLWSTNG